MILKVNNLEPIHITLPAFMCFIWQHLIWFLGLALIVMASIADHLPGTWKIVAMTVTGILVQVIGYIKSQPQPQLPTKE